MTENPNQEAEAKADAVVSTLLHLLLLLLLLLPSPPSLHHTSGSTARIPATSPHATRPSLRSLARPQRSAAQQPLSHESGEARRKERWGVGGNLGSSREQAWELRGGRGGYRGGYDVSAPRRTARGCFV